MTETDLSKLVARLTVLEHVVAMMFRENAIQNGKSANDVSLLAEEVKRFFEVNTRRPDVEMHINAEVDRFFQQIASDIRNQGN